MYGGLGTSIIIIIIKCGCFHPTAPVCGVFTTQPSTTITQLHHTITQDVVATTTTITIVAATTILTTMGRFNIRH